MGNAKAAEEELPRPCGIQPLVAFRVSGMLVEPDDRKTCVEGCELRPFSFSEKWCKAIFGEQVERAVAYAYRSRGTVREQVIVATVPILADIATLIPLHLFVY